jgi:phage major head subunit gpT-like protein
MKRILIIGSAVIAGLAAVAGAWAAPVPELHDVAPGSFLAAGMLVNKENLSALFISLKTSFNNAFAAAPTVWKRIAMLVPSTSGQNDYAWLSKFPRMRRWIGEKNIKNLAGAKYTIVNDDWEATVAVNRNDIEDDNLGIYGPQAQMAGESAAQLPDEIVIELANGAFTNKCFDGKPFCASNHPSTDAAGKKIASSNMFGVPLSAANAVAAAASYGAARIAMRKQLDDEGRPLNITPDVLLVPVALGDIARALMNNDLLGDKDQNPYKGTAEVIEDARLTSDTAWFLLDTTKPVKPFIYQERKKPGLVQQTDPQAEGVFKLKEFLFGAEARAAGGYGFWQLAFGSTGAGA